MMAYRVSQRPNGIIQDEQVFVLVFPKSKDQSVQDKAEIGNKFGASLLLQSRKRTAGEKKNRESKSRLQWYRFDCGLQFRFLFTVYIIF